MSFPQHGTGASRSSRPRVSPFLDPQPFGKDEVIYAPICTRSRGFNELPKYPFRNLPDPRELQVLREHIRHRAEEKEFGPGRRLSAAGRRRKRRRGASAGAGGGDKKAGGGGGGRRPGVARGRQENKGGAGGEVSPGGGGGGEEEGGDDRTRNGSPTPATPVKKSRPATRDGLNLPQNRRPQTSPAELLNNSLFTNSFDRSSQDVIRGMQFSPSLQSSQYSQTFLSQNFGGGSHSLDYLLKLSASMDGLHRNYLLGGLRSSKLRAGVGQAGGGPFLGDAATLPAWGAGPGGGAEGGNCARSLINTHLREQAVQPRPMTQGEYSRVKWHTKATRGMTKRGRKTLGLQDAETLGAWLDFKQRDDKPDWFDRHHVTYRNEGKIESQRQYFDAKKQIPDEQLDYVIRTRQNRYKFEPRPWSEGNDKFFPEPPNRVKGARPTVIGAMHADWQDVAKNRDHFEKNIESDTLLGDEIREKKLLTAIAAREALDVVDPELGRTKPGTAPGSTVT
eukprot:g1885.t1